MKKKEAKRLRDIANELDVHCSKLFWKDPKHSKEAEWFHWAAIEINKVIIDSGFSDFVDAKYNKPCRIWELNKEEE